jgi:hypothetical protein
MEHLERLESLVEPLASHLRRLSLKKALFLLAVVIVAIYVALRGGEVWSALAIHDTVRKQLIDVIEPTNFYFFRALGAAAWFAAAITFVIFPSLVSWLMFRRKIAKIFLVLMAWFAWLVILGVVYSQQPAHAFNVINGEARFNFYRYPADRIRLCEKGVQRQPDIGVPLNPVTTEVMSEWVEQNPGKNPVPDPGCRLVNEDRPSAQETGKPLAEERVKGPEQPGVLSQQSQDPPISLENAPSTLVGGRPAKPGSDGDNPTTGPIAVEKDVEVGGRPAKPGSDGDNPTAGPIAVEKDADVLRFGFWPCRRYGTAVFCTGRVTNEYRETSRDAVLPIGVHDDLGNEYAIQEFKLGGFSCFGLRGGCWPYLNAKETRQIEMRLQGVVPEAKSIDLAIHITTQGSQFAVPSMFDNTAGFDFTMTVPVYAPVHMYRVP